MLKKIFKLLFNIIITYKIIKRLLTYVAKFHFSWNDATLKPQGNPKGLHYCSPEVKKTSNYIASLKSVKEINL